LIDNLLNQVGQLLVDMLSILTNLRCSQLANGFLRKAASGSGLTNLMSSYRFLNVLI
jgi:hypothetical protein